MYTVPVPGHPTILGIIPARGGSKRMPGKNIAPMAGKPLIVHTIDAALQSGVIDRVIVSTDAEDIAAVSRAAGAEVPFLRPSALADDHVTTVEVLVHAIEWLHREESYEPEYVFLLQPTSPQRTAEDIRACVALLQEHAADAVIGVSDHAESPRVVTKNPDGTVTVTVHGGGPLPPGSLALSGAAYLIKTDVLLRGRSLHPPRTFPYFMPANRAIDIDTPEEFLEVERLLRQ